MAIGKLSRVLFIIAAIIFIVWLALSHAWKEELRQTNYYMPQTGAQKVLLEVRIFQSIGEPSLWTLRFRGPWVEGQDPDRFYTITRSIDEAIKVMGVVGKAEMLSKGGFWLRGRWGMSCGLVVRAKISTQDRSLLIPKLQGLVFLMLQNQNPQKEVNMFETFPEGGKE